MRRLVRIFVILFAVIGILAVGAISLAIWGASRIQAKIEPPLPDRMVLTIDLEGQFTQAPDGKGFSRFAAEKTYALRDAAAAIARAAKDDRVTGLFATLGSTKLGMAGIQEITEAVATFKASGKPAVVFAETISESGNGTLEYYLASAFGQIWMQPSGSVGLTGFLVQSPFIKGTLDMLGVRPEFGGRYEYKSAIDMFTEKGFTQPHRENLGQLLDSWTGQVVDGISSRRRLTPEVVRDLVGKGPYLADEAVKSGLVDKLGYRSEALAAAFGPAGKVKEVDVGDYARRTIPKGGAKVAVITGSGPIHRGPSPDQLFGDEQGFGAKTIAKAFRDAAADKDVKAILFRVDSPGGSYVASDTIWNEIHEARKAGKPVVISMGNVAASGGYFVSAPADRVVAEPGTITGSIGVFTGKVVLKELWDKIGVNWDELHRGENSVMWSTTQGFTPQGWERINVMLDAIYRDFTTKAAEGRKIPMEKMDGIARGRIWTGQDAKDLGLVDVLGGFETALGEVKGLAGIGADQPVQLVTYPKPKPFWQLLAGAFGGSGGEGADMRRLMRLVKVLEPLTDHLEGWQTGQDAQLRIPNALGH